jgi:hypothetical protein
MGAGASAQLPSEGPTPHKLRQTLIIRAYNARKSGTSVAQQFAEHRRFDEATGQSYLTREDIRTALSLDSTPQISAMLDQYLGGVDGMVSYEAFLQFISVGSRRPSASAAADSSCCSTATPSPTAAEAAVVKMNEADLDTSFAKPNVIRFIRKSASVASMSDVDEPPTFPGGPRPSKPPTVPQYTSAATAAAAAADDDTSCSTARTAASLLNCDSEAAAATADATVVTTADAATLNADAATEQSSALVLHSSALAATGSGKAVWQKSETVVQERIVCYTTVDSDGRRQELTERERNVTCVVHMECKETGEFAHKEVSLLTLFDRSSIAHKQYCASQSAVYQSLEECCCCWACLTKVSVLC